MKKKIFVAHVFLTILSTCNVLAQEVIQEWLMKYDGDYRDRPSGIVVDSLSNVYVTGYSHDPNICRCALSVTIKYDADGNELWVKKSGGGSDAFPPKYRPPR